MASDEARARIADRLSLDILEYVIDEFLAGRESLDDAAWSELDGPDRSMMEAIARFERGEISFVELEAVGVEYVEAWGRVSAAAG